MLNDSSMVYLINKNTETIHVTTLAHPEGVRIRGAYTGRPTKLLFSVADIRLINSYGNSIIDGLLKIDEKDKEEVLQLLSIYEKSYNDLTAEEIKDIILYPTSEKIKKFVEVTNPVVIDNIRGILINLLKTDEYDISNRVIEVVNKRTEELFEGKERSRIEIKKAKNEPKPAEEKKSTESTEKTEEKQ